MLYLLHLPISSVRAEAAREAEAQKRQQQQEQALLAAATASQAPRPLTIEEGACQEALMAVLQQAEKEEAVGLGKDGRVCIFLHFSHVP